MDVILSPYSWDVSANLFLSPDDPVVTSIWPSSEQNHITSFEQNHVTSSEQNHVTSSEQNPAPDVVVKHDLPLELCQVGGCTSGPGSPGSACWGCPWWWWWKCWDSSWPYILWYVLGTLNKQCWGEKYLYQLVEWSENSSKFCSANQSSDFTCRSVDCILDRK